MICVEQELKNLMRDQANGVCSVSHGRSILPIKAAIDTLANQQCRCPKHRQTPEQALLKFANSATFPYRKNPVWDDDEPMLLIDAAAYIGMPVGTLRQKVYAREISVVMVGKHPKVRPSAIRAYLAKHERPAL